MSRAQEAADPGFGERALGGVMVLLSLGLLGVFVAFDDLPLVDLPQHAAQVTSWLRLGDPNPGFSGRFELNLRTPYLLANALARLLAPLFGVVLALKLVVWLAIVGNMLALLALTRRLGHDPWLALFGMVTACGLCFYFGFISFMLGVTLGLLSLACALDHARAPSLARGALLAVLTGLTLVTHGVAFALSCGLVVVVLLRGAGSLLARLAPLAAPAAVAAFWFLPGPISQRIGGDAWELSWLRFVDLPALLTSFGASDHFAVVLGISLLIVTFLVLGVQPARPFERPLLLLGLLAGYGLFPVMFRGIALLHTRLPAFLLPVLLLAIRAPAGRPRELVRVTRGAVVLLSVTWLGVFAQRTAAFNRESASYHALIRDLPEGLAMRPIIFDRYTQAFPGVPAYLHYAAYYYVEKGGFQGYSFAMYPTSVIRYRPGVKAGMLNAAEWHPEAFDEAAELPDYDFFLVRSELDRGKQLFDDQTRAVVLRNRIGPWWGYEKVTESARAGSALDVPAGL
jgi:hypothetical protein